MLVLLLATACSASVTVDLNGASWSVVQGDGTILSAAPMPATVPGQIHLDLFADGKIDDPYNNTNDQALRWIPMADWTYSRAFDISASVLSKGNIQLVCLGIDTVATLSINGKKIFDADNMFQRYRVDVKDALKAGTNTIQVAFKSKVLEANRTAMACNENTSEICPIRGPSPAAAAKHGFDNVNFLRTEPCSFAWDWGPGYAPVGIWKPIGIEAYDTAVVRDILIEVAPHAASDDALAQRLRTAAAYHTTNEQTKQLGRLPYYDAADAYNGKQNFEMKADEANRAGIARAHQRYVLLVTLWHWKHVCTALLISPAVVALLIPPAIVALLIPPAVVALLISPAVVTCRCRKDRGYDLTTWDAVVNIFLDAGINDLPVTHIYGDDGEGPPKPSNSAAAITGSLLVEITPVAAGGNNPGAEATAPIASKTVGVTLTAGAETKVTINLTDIKGVNAWWPNGFGSQPLYTVKATLTAGKETTDNSVRTGFRAVKLVQNPLPGGKTYYFEINGVPVPVKGSNWIPADAFEPRITRAKLGAIFRGLSESNQNMLRNW
jgi:beta-galactosidase/beta-glucuronidase